MPALTKTDMLRVPSDPLENALWRKAMLERANRDREYREALWFEARDNSEFFFDAFLWTHNPRLPAGERAVPFILWDYQREGVQEVGEHITAGRDLFDEKSRDMGWTWTLLGVLLHDWRFVEDFLAHIGSRKEELVDNRGDMDTHFERVRFMLYRLPWWMVPAGFDGNAHDKHCLLVNPENGSRISGESANQDFGRQGRYTVAVLDEYQ